MGWATASSPGPPPPRSWPASRTSRPPLRGPGWLDLHELMLEGAVEPAARCWTSPSGSWPSRRRAGRPAGARRPVASSSGASHPPSRDAAARALEAPLGTPWRPWGASRKAAYFNAWRVRGHHPPRRGPDGARLARRPGHRRAAPVRTGLRPRWRSSSPCGAPETPTSWTPRPIENPDRRERFDFVRRPSPRRGRPRSSSSRSPTWRTAPGRSGW
jgi:hypothetical protein